MSASSIHRRHVMAAGAGTLLWPHVSPAQVRAREFKMGFQAPRGNSTAEGADRFAEGVARLSGGKMKVSVFPGGALGGDLQMISAIRAGTVDMGTLSAGLMSGMVKEFELLDLPYLFDSVDEAAAVVDGPFGQKLTALLEPKGIVPLGFSTGAFRNLTNSKRPVARLEDLQGLKIRVLQSPLALDLWKAFGTNAVPMPFPELYTALEQKAVDGQENPTSLLLTVKFFEVQKFMSLTRHVLLSAMGIFSKAVWDQLNNEERAIFRQAWTEALKVWRDGAKRDETEALAKLRTLMTVTDLAPAEINRLRVAAKPVIDKHSAGVNPDMLKLLMSEIERVRSKS